MPVYEHINGGDWGFSIERETTPNVTVWVCGHVSHNGWEVMGIFTEKEVALQYCINVNYFVAPMELNRFVGHETNKWPGLVYPISHSAEQEPENTRGE